LARHVRPEQILLDLVRLPKPENLRCEYTGLCWPALDRAL
jgi:hypothetical protein